MSELRRPEGVRIRHPDGRVTLVELAYRGVDPEGLHVWVGMTPVRRGDEVELDELPSRTRITMPMEDER